MAFNPYTTQEQARRTIAGIAGFSLPETGGPTILGLRQSALIELLLFLGLLLAADLLLFGGGRFRDVAPHPFWAIVIVISIQYGTNEGLATALASSAAFLVGNIPEQTLDQDLYDYLAGLALKPALWIVTALILGELRMRERRRLTALGEALEETRNRELQLSRAYERLSARNLKLEERVAGQLRTVVSLYQAAKSLEGLTPGEVLLGVADLVRSVMHPRKFSLYLLNGGLLEATFNEGWEDQDSYTRVFDSNSPLFQEVVGRRQILCAADATHEPVLAHEGLLAAPLASVNTGEVVGMLKIEDMGVLDLHISTVQNFHILADWIDTAWARAHRFTEAESESLMNPEKTLLSSNVFEQMRAFFASLSKRLEFDVTLLILRLRGFEHIEEHERVRYSAMIAEAVRNTLRQTDIAFEYQRNAWEFAVLLPGASVSDARKVADKLKAAVHDLLVSQGGDWRVDVSMEPLGRKEAA